MPKRVISALCCLLLILINIFTGAKINAKAASNTFIRLGGANRYLTSILISQNGWPQTSDYVVIASGEDFPDALCAAPLAKLYDAPILLSHKDSLTSSDISDSLINEIKRLQPKHAFIIGGTGVISDNIKNQLIELGASDCERLAGDDRYGTSLAVAQKIAGKIAEQGSSISNIAVAVGDNYPDALSIAPIAAIKQMPVILTERYKTDEEAEAFIKGVNPVHTYVLGGTGVIDDSVMDSFPNPVRLSGADRYDTNIAVLKQFVDDVSVKFDNLYVSTGDGYADALTGSAAAAKDSAPVLLTIKDYNDNISDTVNYVHSNLRKIQTLKVLGGTGVISDTMVNKLIMPDRVVLGYSTYYNSYDTKSLTTMQNYPSIIDEDVTFTYTTDSSGDIIKAYPVPLSQIQFAKSNGIKAIALITDGFDNDISHPLLSNEAYRQNFIKQIINEMGSYGYGGVNIDFEGMQAYDRNNFTTFIQELYNSLHPLGYLVTISAVAKTYDYPNDNWTGPFDYVQLGKYADQVALMTYDYHWSGGSYGPIAPIDWVTQVVNYAAGVIPRYKILLGIEAYAYDWSEEAGARTQAYGVTTAMNVAAQYGEQIIFDSASECPHFDYTDSSGYKHHVWFENAQSLAYKLDLVNSQDLGGVAMWNLTFPDAAYMNIIKTKFNK